AQRSERPCVVDVVRVHRGAGEERALGLATAGRQGLDATQLAATALQRDAAQLPQRRVLWHQVQGPARLAALRAQLELALQRAAVTGQQRLEAPAQARQLRCAVELHPPGRAPLALDHGLAALQGRGLPVRRMDLADQ